jgi:hypothetical protein
MIFRQTGPSMEISEGRRFCAEFSTKLSQNSVDISIYRFEGQRSRIDVSSLSPLCRKGRHQSSYRRDYLQQASCLQPSKALGYDMFQQVRSGLQ